MTDTTTALPASRREERRQDRLVEAQIARDAEAAAAKLRAADRKTALDRKLAAQARRAARWRAAGAMLAPRVPDMLLTPVIAACGILSWTGMAGYGISIYGIHVGWLLSVVSEGGMWAFAAAATVSLVLHPQSPVTGLRAGTAVFAAVAGGLNFAHGDAKGFVTGLVMAVVSVSGVVAHQIITAPPARSRADRGEARLRRAEHRRLMAAKLAAVRATVVHFDGEGGARLVYVTGRAKLAWGILRAKLERPEVSHSGEPAGGSPEAAPEAQKNGSSEALESSTPAPENEPPAAPVQVASREPVTGSPETSAGDSATGSRDGSPGPVKPQADAGFRHQDEAAYEARSVSLRVDADSPPEKGPEPARDEPVQETRPVTRQQPKTGPRKTRPAGKSDTVTALIKAGVSNAEIVRRTGLSLATVKRRRTAFKESVGNVVPMPAQRRAAGQGR